MKKIYLFLFLLMGFLTMPVHAVDVVTELGNPVTDLSTIKAGDKIVFFCNGPINPDDKEYGLRMAYLREGDDNNLFLSRDFQEGSLKTQDFIWTVISYEPLPDDPFSFTIKLASPRGNNLPAFTANTTKPKYTCQTVAPADGEAAPYTVTLTESGDSLFYIYDDNGVFFNGQSIPLSQPKGQAKFVGWNSTGGNSLYKIYLPKVEEKNTVEVNITLRDEYGVKPENPVVTHISLLGDTLRVPKWEAHNYSNAYDTDTEEVIEFPYVVDGNHPYITCMYEIWPMIKLTCYDKETGEIIYQDEDFKKKGTKFTYPTKEQIGIGYSLVTEGYDDYIYDQDDQIKLEYVRDGKNLPFVATTLVDGKLAPDTKWYMMNINGGKTVGMVDSTLAISCGAVSELTDAHLWCFVGNPKDGYKIYNKSTMEKQIIWAPDGANKTQVYMTNVEETAEPNTFDIDFNGDGFNFKLHGTENSYLNDLGEKGIVKFWAHANSAQGNGSRFTFFEYTPEFGHAFVYGKYISYLDAQDCVGGWTEAQLSDLKQAYTAQDTMACRVAVEALAEQPTIEFDAKKSYNVISAFQDFITYQPGVKYCMAANVADSSVVWKAIENGEDAACQFAFNAATDSTYFMVNVANQLPIAGFRFEGFAKCVAWGNIMDEANRVVAGNPADFKMVKSTVAPASFYFIHNYGASIITLSCDPVRDAKATSGKISTYNTKELQYNNYWRLKPAGNWTGIADDVTVAPQGEQKIYDLCGRKVTKPTRGLYIINGKKVYIK